MTWLVPSALAIAGVAAAITIALHFIARSTPLAEPLPTTRFIPAAAVHARSRSVALTDLLLLLVRIAALLAIGLAIAAPSITGRGRVTRIVLLDRSRAVADLAESRDSLRALSGASTVIAFDSAATSGVTSLNPGAITASAARGSLSAALAGAIGSAATLSRATDSVALVLVSPLAAEEIDDATMRIRAAWPGRIRIIPVRQAPALPALPRVTVRGEANDAVAAGLALMGRTGSDGAVRVVRGSLTTEDSVWAMSDGHVLVHWPASAAFADWPSRSTIDAVGGVTSSTGTIVARFPRVWILRGRAVARWSDGTEAAVEHATGSGCIRHVGILIDDASDLALRQPFRAFATALIAPCGGARSSMRVADATLAAIAGSGGLAPSDALRDRAAEMSRWTPWLFLLGALILIGELALRRSMPRSP